MDVIVPLYPEIGDSIKTMAEEVWLAPDSYQSNFTYMSSAFRIILTPVISFTNRSIISWKQFTGIPFLDNQLDTGKVNYISRYTVHVKCFVLTLVCAGILICKCIVRKLLLTK